MANAISAFPTRISNLIDVDRKCVLGEGNSVVYKGTYQQKIVAVKRIELIPSINGDGDHCEAQMKLNHENVLKLLAVEEDDDFRYFVLELCSGTLFQAIQNTYDGPALPTDSEVLYQIAAGLAYIHSKELAHRDIKPENILISIEGQIKLSEFGLKRQTKDKCYITGLKGALLWMAPEQFQSIHEETEIEIAQKSDVFSCGCVFFVFLMRENGGIHPFGDIFDHLQIHANIQEGNSINIHKAKDNHPLEAKLIKKMIQRDPVKRMTSEDVKNKIGDLLPNRSNTMKPLTLQIGLICNQSEAAASHEKLAVDYGRSGAKSVEKRYKNHDFEVARYDGNCVMHESVSTSYPGNRGILPNGQQSAKKRSTFAPPAKQQRYDFRDLTSAGISNDRRNPDYHPWLNSASKTHTIPEVTVNVREREESEWKLNEFDSQQSSCDSNNNHDVALK